MTSTFGANGDQVVQFIEAAQGLAFEHVPAVVKELNTPATQAAQDRVHAAPRSAARYSAIESAARTLLATVRAGYPQPSSTAEKFEAVGFGIRLKSAVFAMASRPQLDDDTVGILVDPIAERVGFEWRSWGVSQEGAV